MAPKGSSKLAGAAAAVLLAAASASGTPALDCGPLENGPNGMWVALDPAKEKNGKTLKANGASAAECRALCSTQAAPGVCLRKQIINDPTWGTATPCYFVPGGQPVDYRARFGNRDTRHFASACRKPRAPAFHCKGNHLDMLKAGRSHNQMYTDSRAIAVAAAPECAGMGFMGDSGSANTDWNGRNGICAACAAALNKKFKHNLGGTAGFSCNAMYLTLGVQRNQADCASKVCLFNGECPNKSFRPTTTPTTIPSTTTATTITTTTATTTTTKATTTATTTVATTTVPEVMPALDCGPLENGPNGMWVALDPAKEKHGKTLKANGASAAECRALCSTQAGPGVCLHKQIINDPTWGTATPCYFVPGGQPVDYSARYGNRDTRHFASACRPRGPAPCAANLEAQQAESLMALEKTMAAVETTMRTLIQDVKAADLEAAALEATAAKLDAAIASKGC